MERTLVQARREQVARADAPAARVLCEAIEFETTAALEFIDITDDITAIVDAAGVQFGQVSVFSQHTTAAIKINENEPLLLRDLARTLRQFAPPNAYYEHNDFSRRTVNMNDDECANGHAHCQHLFLGASETIPVIDARIALGRWQRVFLIELDHPRLRRVLVNVVGTG
jgi:secondary thiamine-phosphate synthase enzyme